MIPKIIHQVWEGIEEPLPDSYKQLGETWKEHHPEWKYELWNKDRMEAFTKKKFPEITDVYFNYLYSVQRWDVIRYLILYEIGGMYVDFDYECFKPFDNYIKETGKCYFAMEPAEHCRIFGKDFYFNNALMITPPGHPFFECIIRHLQTTSFNYSGNKMHDVLSSTGPWMLTSLYEKYDNKAIVDFFLPNQVSPWSKMEAQNYIKLKLYLEKMEKRLKDAIAIHYFSGSW